MLRSATDVQQNSSNINDNGYESIMLKNKKHFRKQNSLVIYYILVGLAMNNACLRKFDSLLSEIGVFHQHLHVISEESTRDRRSRIATSSITIPRRFNPYNAIHMRVIWRN